MLVMFFALYSVVGLGWALWEDRFIYADLGQDARRELGRPYPGDCNCPFHRFDNFLVRHRCLAFVYTTVLWAPSLLYVGASILYHRGLPY